MDRRYLIVIGACMTQFTVIGLLFAYALFFKAFEDEFGWSRTLLSAGTSAAFLVMGVLAILGGRLNDRYGPKIVLGSAGVICGAGFALISQISQPWHLFILFGLFVGIGMSTHDVVTLSTIARWFEKRRGIMTGVVKTGTAIGQVAMPLIAAFLIASQGWRGAVVIMGLSAIVLLVLAAGLMKLPPEPKATTTAPQAGLSFQEARHTRAFWSLCLMQFLFFPTLMTVPLHIVVHGTDLGMTAENAAVLLSIVGASSIAGRLTVGTFTDRIGGRWSYVMCFVPLLISLFGLIVADQHWALYGIMAIYGFGHGGLFTVVSPTVAEFFGLRAHGAIFGPILFFGTIGGSIGPIIAGWIFDASGSYLWAFTGLAVMVGAAIVLALSLPQSQTMAAPAE
ncbi:MAG: MFS transporter [Pseudomonadota bacterium]